MQKPFFLWNYDIDFQRIFIFSNGCIDSHGLVQGSIDDTADK